MQPVGRAFIAVFLFSNITFSSHVCAQQGILRCLLRGRPICIQPCERPNSLCVATPDVAFIEGNASVEGDAKGNVEVNFEAIAKEVAQAKTIAMTVTPYMSFTNKDESRIWIQPLDPSELAFRAPHAYRDTRLRGGVPFMVQIVDAKNKESLTLRVREKKAFRTHPTVNIYGTEEANPLATLGRMLAEKTPLFVETREIDGRTVEVYRFQREQRNKTLDIWIDADSKKLYAISDPGGDQLDMSLVIDATEARPRRQRGKGRMAGIIRHQIRIDEPLDADSFSLEVPGGYELMEAPQLPGGPINPQ